MKAEQKQFNCPVEATLSLIGGKYKPLVLWHLKSQPLHYMELQRLIPKATPKMLSGQLHDLEDCGMINREVIPEKPPKTIYSLTAFGKSRQPTEQMRARPPQVRRTRNGVPVVPQVGAPRSVARRLVRNMAVKSSAAEKIGRAHV